MNQFGLYIQTIGGKDILKFNGRVIDSVVVSVDGSKGLLINGNNLDLNGLTLACSSKQAKLIADGDSVYFGDVNLLDKLECVDITLENYNSLKVGEPVAGYKRFNKDTIYNIVQDVANATTIQYTIANNVIIFSSGNVTAPKTDFLVFNSVSGDLQDNTLDNTKTMLDVNCPFVNVRYFESIISANQAINITYYVDDRYMSSLKHGSLDKTFTVIIETESGQVAKKTTYAGEFTLATPTFTTNGETWFSIKCIDSDGIGSVVQYYDVLVRSTPVENFYTMQQSDLTTYGITLNNNDQYLSYDNKIGLSNLFAAVKDGSHNGTSYNGIVMLEGLYWINYHKNLSENGGYDFGTQRYFEVGVTDVVTIEDGEEVVTHYISTVNEITESAVKSVFPTLGDISYKTGAMTNYTSKVPTVGSKISLSEGTHYMVYNTAHNGGDYVVVPSDFTVDMNGATFKAIPSTDVFNGYLVNMESCFDSHLKNGKLVGNYENYDFYNSLIRTGVAIAGEALALLRIQSCRYCSLENMEFSYSMGYAGGWGGGYGSYGQSPVVNDDVDGKRVNITNGEVISADDMVVISKQNSKSPANFDVEGFNEICLGRWGYGGYGMGKQREIFYSFYDSNGNYIKTIKSKLYSICKVPSSAVSVKITGYGTSDKWPVSTNNGGLSLFRNPEVSKSLDVIDCTWHDTRTCAINPTLVHGLKYKNCFFTNVATYMTGEQAVTTMLGDFEDGWQWLTKVLFDGCRCVKGSGTTMLYIHYCRGLDFKNCDNIYLYNSGGIESGFVEDSNFSYFNIAMNYKSFNPNVIYRRNEIGTLGISYNGDTSNSLNVGTIDRNVAMIDTTIHKKCLYKNLLLFGDSINGLDDLTQ